MVIAVELVHPPLAPTYGTSQTQFVRLPHRGRYLRTPVALNSNADGRAAPVGSAQAGGEVRPVAKAERGGANPFDDLGTGTGQVVDPHPG
ncbi:hypothetical protein C8D88_104110 [Lentzea atacamensis]|uniref:Uncharacterized protein n=1 Tax=Lentzea atacamensis TaxID=531938 RepID=A0A316IID3_9PSEU|nr:hypothetical protein C8D88_104110 [Lentzea atacamensis]